MRNTTRPSSLHLNDRQQKRPERIRTRVRPFMILAKATAHRIHRIARSAVFVAEAAAVAVVAMAKAASNISKAIEAAHKVPERPGNTVHASLAES
jgi:hypothetical protein